MSQILKSICEMTQINLPVGLHPPVRLLGLHDTGRRGRQALRRRPVPPPRPLVTGVPLEQILNLPRPPRFLLLVDPLHPLLHLWGRLLYDVL